MKKILLNRATKFVILLGLISLFSDMTYEAARSINGSFLQILGTNAITVGWVAGLGELLGYGLRLFSGYLADKTKKYWTILIIGYTLNLISVPLLAFAGYWQLAIFLIIAERVGKALRTPSRDALLSFGTQQMGRGWGYGLHEAMDQIGATLGPILVSVTLLLKNQNYAAAYGILAIPAIIAISILLVCKHLYPNPQNLEVKKQNITTRGFSHQYWIYLLATIFIAVGYIDFPLIAYHFKSISLMEDSTIPILYSIAMAVDALAALVFGKFYDKFGIKTLVVAIILSTCFAPFVFSGNFFYTTLGMVLWGIGMGAQESILKAQIAEMTQSEKRGTAFGTFNTAFGFFWFLGSLTMGYLYELSITYLILFSVFTQILGLIVLIYLLKRFKMAQ